MVGAVIGATLAVVGTWYILNHQAGIKAWFQNLGKSLAPTPSTPSGGGTPPPKTAPSAAPHAAPAVPVVHPTYPDASWTPLASTIAPVTPPTSTNNIHPTTHTPSPKPSFPSVSGHQLYSQPSSTGGATANRTCNGIPCTHIRCADIENCADSCGWTTEQYLNMLRSPACQQEHPAAVTQPHSHPMIPAPVAPQPAVHHVAPPSKKQPKQPRDACTNTKMCGNISCCHVTCNDIDKCRKPCGWSDDDYGKYLASCIHAVNITK